MHPRETARIFLYIFQYLKILKFVNFKKLNYLIQSTTAYRKVRSQNEPRVILIVDNHSNY